MMINLENDLISASVHPTGAELHNLYNKKTGLEYLWNGDPEFWPRHSPVLFPIVGGLIDDSFVYKGETYSMIKHGFARDSDFELENSTKTSASFILRSSEKTLQSYPFEFLLRIKYAIHSNKITVTYEVENPSNETLYFSLGTHPAFNIPLVEGTVYTDYYLQFQQAENSVRHTLDGNILASTTPYLENQDKLPLKQSLFYEDAVIFKDLKSTTISIKTDKSPHGLNFTFEGFPYMGIWAATDAPFVCIEPWCGIADSATHNQKIEEKEGIIALSPAKTWSRSWSLECF